VLHAPVPRPASIRHRPRTRRQSLDHSHCAAIRNSQQPRTTSQALLELIASARRLRPDTPSAVSSFHLRLPGAPDVWLLASRHVERGCGAQLGLASAFAPHRSLAHPAAIQYYRSHFIRSNELSRRSQSLNWRDLRAY